VSLTILAFQSIPFSEMLEAVGAWGDTTAYCFPLILIYVDRNIQGLQGTFSTHYKPNILKLLQIWSDTTSNKRQINRQIK
jgi:hypothetical protein